MFGTRVLVLDISSGNTYTIRSLKIFHIFILILEGRDCTAPITNEVPILMGGSLLSESE